MSQQMIPKSEQAARASQALDNGGAFAVGSYRLNSAGGSVRLTAADEFCKHHDIGKGEEVDEWIDYETGALIILPKKNE